MHRFQACEHASRQSEIMHMLTEPIARRRPRHRHQRGGLAAEGVHANGLRCSRQRDS